MELWYVPTQRENYPDSSLVHISAETFHRVLDYGSMIFPIRIPTSLSKAYLITSFCNLLSPSSYCSLYISLHWQASPKTLSTISPFLYLPAFIHYSTYGNGILFLQPIQIFLLRSVGSMLLDPVDALLFLSVAFSAIFNFHDHPLYCFSFYYVNHIQVILDFSLISLILPFSYI